MIPDYIIRADQSAALLSLAVAVGCWLALSLVAAALLRIGSRIGRRNGAA